jgi:hypothetical protein
MYPSGVRGTGCSRSSRSKLLLLGVSGRCPTGCQSGSWGTWSSSCRGCRCCCRLGRHRVHHQGCNTGRWTCGSTRGQAGGKGEGTGWSAGLPVLLPARQASGASPGVQHWKVDLRQHTWSCARGGGGGTWWSVGLPVLLLAKQASALLSGVQHCKVDLRQRFSGQGQRARQGYGRVVMSMSCLASCSARCGCAAC